MNGLAKMPSVKEGYFQMLRPCKSFRGNFWIIGAIVGAGNGFNYTKRVESPKDFAVAIEKLRLKIMKDHPGIKEVGSQWH